MAIENKVEWCIKKALKELAEGKKHRGLKKIEPDIAEIRKHIAKAEHNLKAISYFSKGGFSDWSMSSCFYCIYHCFLAIALKFGYESRNQECTLALIKILKEDNKIRLDEKFIQAIETNNDSDRHETNIIEEREKYTYGTSTSIDNKKELEEAIELCKECLDETKKIVF